tara:strand:+ start:102 stop:653 length:552 start_codon:yes stop_codon:yes gene_type:complete
MFHDVIVLDDDIQFEKKETYEIDEIFHTKTRRKMHRNNKKCKLICNLYEEINTLRRENELMSTLCGYKEFAYIIDAAVIIQSAARGWILRHDKHVFDRSINLFLRNCRMYLARKHFKDMKKAAIFLQSHVRGFLIRKLAVGKAVGLVSKYKNEITQLEAVILRLTSMIWCPAQYLEKAQIHVT